MAMRPRRVAQRQDPVDVVKASVDRSHDCIAAIDDRVEPRQLAHGKHGVHVRHVLLEPWLLHLRLRRAALLCAVVRIHLKAMEAEPAHCACEVRVVGGEHAALSGGDVLDRVQREDRAACATDLPAAVCGADRVRRILEQEHAALGANCPDGIKVDGRARVVHGDHNLRARRDRGLERLRRCKQGVPVNVDEDISRTDQLDHVGRRDPGHGGSDDLVSGPHPEG